MIGIFIFVLAVASIPIYFLWRAGQFETRPWEEIWPVFAFWVVLLGTVCVVEKIRKNKRSNR